MAERLLMLASARLLRGRRRRDHPRMLARVLATLLPMLAASAAEWRVAAAAPAGGDGSAERPFARIQAALDRAGAGDRVVVARGVYRESLTTRGGAPDRPLTLEGEDGALVDGADPVDGFVAVGDPSRATWLRRGWGVDSQQVLVDDAELARVGPPPSRYAGKDSDGSVMLEPRPGTRDDLPPGSFIVDGGDLYLRLADGSDPNAHAVAASTRGRLLRIDGGDVRLVGLAFRHSNTSAEQKGGAAVELGDRCVAERCVFARCDFAGVALGWKRAGSRLVDCVVVDNGCMGVQADGHAGFAVERTLIARNNTRGFNTQWAAAGLKTTTDAWGEIVDCDVRDNRGVGIWFDWCLSGHASVVRGNRVSGNHDRAAGIMIEASADVVVVDNAVIDNEERGVYVSASERVTVCHDTIVGTRGIAALEISGTPRAGRRLADVRAFNDVIAGNASRYDVRIVRENGDDVRALSFHHSLVWRDGGPRLWWGADGRGHWLGATFADAAAWRAVSGLGEATIAAPPRFVAPERGDYGIDPDSPARGAGWTGDALGRADLGAAMPRPAP